MTETSESPKADDPSGIVSIQQLNAHLKQLVEERTKGELIRIRGMAWNVRRSQFAHVHFQLRHEKYGLPCTALSILARRLPFRIEDRQQLIVEGKIEVYEPWGELRLLVNTIKLDVEAKEDETFTALKARAEAEGWLARDRKRPLPRPPKMIGLITGGGSRARRDVRGSVRKAGVQTQVFDETANMEAPDTAQQIITAVASLNERSDVDLIVIARGGGNQRVLWALNDWELERAIVHSDKPVMAAIGHWQDETLADLVADASAPTPSLVGTVLAEQQAAELVPSPEIAQEQATEPVPGSASDQEQAAQRDQSLAIALIAIAIIVVIVLIAGALGWI